MKLSQCITFTAIAATLLSTQTAAAKIGRPKADKASTQDQYETVLVQAKADKASYEKVIRSPTYAATPYPDSKFIDNPIWAKAGKGGRNLDRYGTAVILVESKAGKGEAGNTSPGKEGDRCRFPIPNCGRGLKCTRVTDDYPRCLPSKADGQYETVLVDDSKGSNKSGWDLCYSMPKERCEDADHCYWHRIGYCMTKQRVGEYDNLIKTKVIDTDEPYTESKEEDNVDFFIGRPGKEGDRCTFPTPNCGKGLNCVNRLNGNPICHRNDVCRPSGMSCLGDSQCCDNGKDKGKCVGRRSMDPSKRCK